MQSIRQAYLGTRERETFLVFGRRLPSFDRRTSTVDPNVWSFSFFLIQARGSGTDQQAFDAGGFQSDRREDSRDQN